MVANNCFTADQVERYGAAGYGQLLQPTIRQILSQHRINFMGAIQVHEMPVAAVWKIAKEKGRLEVHGDYLGPPFRCQAGSIRNAGHRPRARPSNHVDDNPILLQNMQNSQMGRSARGAPTQSQPNLDAAQVMNDPFQAGFTQWRLCFREGYLEIA